MVLRFRSPACRRAKLCAASLRARLPACTPRLGHPRGCFCFIASLRDHTSYSRLRCSALRRRLLLWPLLTSANLSENLSIPVALRHACRSPRVLRTHLHAYVRRMYVASFRASFGLQRYWPSYPNAPPVSASCSSNQRFACGFLRIPSRPRHPCRPANISPYRACRGLSPPRGCALPGAPKKNGGLSRPAVRVSKLAF